MTRPVRPLDTPRSLLDEALDRLGDDEAVRARLTAAQARLDEPVRVALAGKVKAGKSTLLNAVIGDRVAPTDTGECTRVVTWYRHGHTPSVTVHPRTGRPRPQPVHRVDGRLQLTTGGLDAGDVDRIEVRWPTPALTRMTLVDTPGLASLSEELSRTSTAALTPGDSVSQVDAVVYLMRHLHASDADFLEAYRDQQSLGNQPALTLAVLSRADEVGAGRIDSLLSAARVAQRYRSDPAVRALALDVVPVAGLLAESGRTLRQREFEALRDLASLGRERRESLLLSADRFVSMTLEDSPFATTQVRAALIQRLGVFGIRLSTVLVRDGFFTASALADELVRRSGLDEVTQILTTQFAARAEALKGRAALLAVQRELDRRDDPDDDLAERVDLSLRIHHDAEELRLITTIRTAPPPGVTAPMLERAEALLGGAGTDPAHRLRRPDRTPSAELVDDALTAIQEWRHLQSDPTVAEPTRELCRVVIRSAEGVVAALDAQLAPAGP